MKEHLINEIKDFNNQKLIIQKSVKQFVQDKSLPLSDRWEIFCLGEQKNLIPKEQWIVRFKNFNVDELFDNYSRYEDVDLVYQIELMEDENIDVEDFKEEILDKFICSFNLDW